MALVLNQQGVQFSETIAFYVEHCCECGVPFAITRETYNVRRADGKQFYCPNGHPQYYAETTAARLEKELARERQRRDQAEADARYAREDAKRQVTAMKGKMTKLKNRVGNGVCPCCQRSFHNLSRHMQSQHPEFKQPEA